MDHDTREAALVASGRVPDAGGRERSADEVAHQLARGLGWFSIGLGLAELVAPEALSRMVGARAHPALVRAYGAREMASGIGLLSGRGTAEWMWSRVAGDAVDLGSLWLAREERGADPARLGLATAAVAGVTMLDLAVAAYLTGSGGTTSDTSAIEGDVLLNEPAYDMPIT